jgi:hypothetical protein
MNRLRYFKMFESKISDISKDDIEDIFQEYLDNLDGDSLAVDIRDGSILVSIKNQSWVDKEVGIGIVEKFSKMWLILLGSIKMMSSMYNLQVDNIFIENDENSPVFVQILFKLIGSSKEDGKIITFNDIMETSRGSVRGDRDILVQSGSDAFFIERVIVNSDRIILKTIGRFAEYYEDTDYNTIPTSGISSLISIIDDNQDLSAKELSKEIDYNVDFEIKIQTKSIRNFEHLPIHVSLGKMLSTPSKIILGENFKDIGDLKFDGEYITSINDPENLIILSLDK